MAAAPAIFFPGGGEMGERIRSFDWSGTPVGPVKRWPESLKTAVRICLGSRHPIVMWWGRIELTQFYNNAYISFLGATKHPGWLGKSGRECWQEIWQVVGPMVESVFATGEATWSEDLLLVLNRNLPREEGYFTFSYSPLPDDSGAVGGIFCACNETTGRVIGERRLRTLRDLGRTVMSATTADEACEIASKTLADNSADIPYALIYLLDRDGQKVHLTASTGLESGSGVAPATIEWKEAAGNSIWPLHRVFETGSAELLTNLSARFGHMPAGPWPESSENALILPIAAPGQGRPTGFLIAGLSPRRMIDADYRSFFDLIAGHVATAVSNARAYEEERRRAEALAELDRAKTAFFSNVSHEFRTPLTLMLGPLEDMLSTDGVAPARMKEQIAVAHRNGLRLQKLVNSLLDFSRIEAGRAQASYEPTDLAALTAELASAFRSAMESAGLRFTVDCPPLNAAVYVDREMWEKIVLNLLSNAFKYTLTDQVALTIKASEGRVELSVADSGIGIPESEIPHLFKRFHRVENARGRTHEGTGIGLALVSELVKLHGGSVAVASQMGKGSTFRVSLPFGAAHLPQDRLNASRPLASTALHADSYIEEARRWMPGAEAKGAAVSPASSPRSKVLVADDNADMRDYIRRLLESQYEVKAVSNGDEALAAVLAAPPDLVLTDIMMPILDGFGLLRALRQEERTRTIPVILLSARAGEESRVEGLNAGADDYLIKPFTARELRARVDAHLSLTRMRRQMEQEMQLRNEALERANSDLEQFAFSASHDLQEPLRSITIYSELLTKRYRDRLDGQALEYLTYLRSGALRMELLVSDLLDYTRAGKTELSEETSDANRVLLDVIDMLHESCLEAGARITSDPLPSPRIHGMHLGQLFQNLLSNAIKYRSPERAPLIHVTAEPSKDDWVFSVRDNGIGIAPEYRERIFGLFKRLHSGDEYSGTGIGLAICQRIVERYGGRIWVESVPGKGSAFFFTLPYG
ncbi:MAG TPA: ATP-binding protein [Bryobacteraceae bacterium]